MALGASFIIRVYQPNTVEAEYTQGEGVHVVGVPCVFFLSFLTAALSFIGYFNWRLSFAGLQANIDLIISQQIEVTANQII